VQGQSKPKLKFILALGMGDREGRECSGNEFLARFLGTGVESACVSP
jgi:hypothetical protein